MNFTGDKCPCCNKRFEREDDIVVCPVCGTPFHRECYKAHGRCINEEKHGTGFEWKSEATPAVSHSGGLQICPSCGATNPDSATSCESCGRQLGGNMGLGRADSRSAAATPFARNTSESGDPLERSLWPYSFEDVSPTDEVDGHSVREWVKYIARSAGYYIYCFKAQDAKKNKTAFTWSAMVVPLIYFLYRKVWWAAAAAFGASLVCQFPNFVSVFLEAGILPGGVLWGLSTEVWANIASYTSMALLGLNVVWGVFAVWIYRRHSAKTMDRLRESHPDEEGYQNALRRASGPSLIAAIAIPFAISMLISLLLVGCGVVTPENVNALSSMLSM